MLLISEISSSTRCVLNKMRSTLLTFKNAVVFVLIVYCFGAESTTPKESIHFLEPGDVVENNLPKLQIFCHNAKSKYLNVIWKSITMNINTHLDIYDLYEGQTPLEVMQKHEDNQRSWRFNIFGSKKNKQIKINPFVDVCIGVYVYPSNQHKYTMSMNDTRIDTGKLITMILGIIVYWYAERLSRNTLFYYICGITLGITTSVLILIYFVSKLFPRGKVMYLMVASGWAMGFLLAQTLWENAQLILVQYTEWVMWYIFITAVISFLICYRFGPVTNARTKKIIQWMLQISALTAIYYSSYFREASISCCVILFILYNFPVVAFSKGKTYWKRMFPDRRKLLSDDQYRREGIRETNKALTELQQYCSSPECKQWKTILKLRNPIRFAKFVEGESHISDEEIEEHDAEITRVIEECEYTDDEEDY